MYYKNTANQDFFFDLTDIATGLPLLGQTVTGYRTIDGGAQAATTGVVTETGHGQYRYTIALAETLGDEVGFQFSVPGVSLLVSVTISFAGAALAFTTPYMPSDALDLAGVRWKFYKMSGRADLVKSIDEAGETCADNGADFFINRGIRYLDSLQDTPMARKRAIFQMVAGEYFTEMPDCRTVDRVYAIKSDGVRTLLLKVDLEWLRENYAKSFETVDRGAPLYYAPNVNQVASQNLGDTNADYAGMFDWEDLIQGYAAGAKGILVMPPVDSTFTISVYGKFFSAELVNDTDSNFWASEYPDLVVMAASRLTEVMMRNSEGVKDWDNAIAASLRGIDFDLAEDESNEVRELAG